MCTVIVEVPRDTQAATRVLAVRDELPGRPWDPPGLWWPELPGVRGVRDRQAGGAWLATREGALSVILNRGESIAEMLGEGHAPLESRGGIVLRSVQGEQLPKAPHTESFNLVEVRGPHTTFTQWNGEALTSINLEPGTHMVAHGMVDDEQFARIEAWLPRFRALEGVADHLWRRAWIDTLELSAEAGPDDDRAIIRDNTVHGYPTKSLLVCLAEVRQSAADLESATLREPARWHQEPFVVS